MRITLLSIPVQDQQKALEFYTEKLEFTKKQDIPLGEGNRWLTLVAEEDPEGPELLLEPAPIHFEPSKTYQTALFDAGIPGAQFEVDSVQKEFDRLVNLGVEFRMEPTEMDNVRFAVFNDTCGNYIQIVEWL
jgi:catechol 2,3-dioxygenase-like lactoylglutathione lyase family enzyme